MFDGYAIIGSSNFSKGGLSGNSELNVLTKDCYPNLQAWFNNLWESDNVKDFSMELVEFINTNVDEPKYYKSPFIVKEEPEPYAGFSMPLHLKIRDYQMEAIKSWFKSGGRGILEMATGTGKTFTALAASTKLFEQTKQLAIVIVCPYKHLVDQWSNEVKRFGLSPILCYGLRTNWENKLNSRITSFNIGAIPCFCLITTTTSFSLDSMQNALKRLKGNVLLIADEVHHMGAKRIREKLPDNIPYRLGLSATPDRWHDDIGSNYLRQYFENGVVFTFGLKEAIGQYLTEYYYFPHIITLTDEECEEYFALTQKIYKRIQMGDTIDDSDSSSILKNLLIKRARLLSKAENKIVKLRELAIKEKDSKYNIFYCGDTTVDGERQIEKVLQVLGNGVGMRVHPFTSDETRQERLELLGRFKKGELQGLVAIRCLDEGVDVPATRSAYILASSTNPREFIQRRGRILRKSPGKEYSYIHDFIVIPRDINELNSIDVRLFNTERKLVRRELRRFKEFADLAINGPEARLKILEVAKAFNLLDF
ncbi:MAG: DEAD/DEAH box helicase family protein [Bacillota bacterium]